MHNLTTPFKSNPNFEVAIKAKNGLSFEVTKLLTAIEEPIIVALELQKKYGRIVQNIVFERTQGTISTISEMHESFYFECGWDDSRRNELHISVLAKYLAHKNTLRDGVVTGLKYSDQRKQSRGYTEGRTEPVNI